VFAVSVPPAPPDMPLALSWLVWGIAVVVVLLALAWRAFVWLRDQMKDVFRNELQGPEYKKVLAEELEGALASRAFKTIVADEVTAQFQGAVTPLMTADQNLAGQIALADAKATSAHGRLDVVVSRLNGHIEECGKQKGAAA
jgi:hypothetical protein